MATDRQITANRRNSQHSTGPRTPEGKAASSANSLKSGIYSRSPIVPGEDPDELEALRTEYYDSFQPANADERNLLDAMITNRWTLNRLHATFHQQWIWGLEDNADSPHQHLSTHLVRTYNRNEDHFAKLTRMIASFDRAFHRARTALIQAQKQRRRSQPIDPEPTSPDLASFRQKTIAPPSTVDPAASALSMSPLPPCPAPDQPTPPAPSHPLRVSSALSAPPRGKAPTTPAAVPALAPNPAPDIPLTLPR